MVKCSGSKCKSDNEIDAFLKTFVVETRVIQKEVDFTKNYNGEPTVMSDRILNYASLTE